MCRPAGCGARRRPTPLCPFWGALTAARCWSGHAQMSWVSACGSAAPVLAGRSMWGAARLGRSTALWTWRSYGNSLPSAWRPGFSLPARCAMRPSALAAGAWPPTTNRPARCPCAARRELLLASSKGTVMDADEYVYTRQRQVNAHGARRLLAAANEVMCTVRCCWAAVCYMLRLTSSSF